MFQGEALQIWFCLFHKFIKTQYKINFNSSKFKKFLVIKIEQIVELNGFFASRILQYPQKFVSIIKYADEKINKGKIFPRNSFFPQMKTLILFDHIFEKFSHIFSQKYLSLCPRLIGKLVFIQGLVVNEGPVMVKKFERNLIRQQIKFQDHIKSLMNEFYHPRSRLENFGIETQDIKIITKFKNFPNQNNLEPIFIVVSLVGKMVEVKKKGKKINLWGIVRKKNEDFLNQKNNLILNLTIEAVSIFLEKKKKLYEKNLKHKVFPLLDFLLFSYDSKIKGSGLNFIKKILSGFLSRKFTEIFKTLILFSLLGGCSKKNLLKLNRNSINICFIQKSFDAQFKLFYQIQKIFKNSAYISDCKNSSSNWFLNEKKVSFFLKNKQSLEQNINKPWFFFVDHIDFWNKKDYDFLGSIILKKSLKFFFKNTKLKIRTPFSVLANLNFDQFFSNFETFENYPSNEVQKFFSLFDIITSFPVFMIIQNKYFVPFFFTLKYTDKKTKIWNLENFWKKNKLRSFSSFNLSRYLLFLKSFKNPIFSSCTEKLLVLWYLSDLNEKISPEIKIIFLEKLIKFSQASAKIFNRDVILLVDGIFAISIIEKLYFNFKMKNKFNIKKKEKEITYFFKHKKNQIFKRNKIFEIFKHINPTSMCNGNLFFLNYVN
jgi:DNA replicative helicase MCM subunit Mcm2 (Cdc46/Mcm family)